MTILRILVAAPPGTDSVRHWALYDDAGRPFRSGHDRPAVWPAADTVEGVVTATQVRVATLTLPPLPPPQLAAAAAFALEDELAGPLEGQHLAASRQQSDGRVRVAIVDKALMTALKPSVAERPLSRIVVEPDLASTLPGWRWCAEGNRGFVRTTDGSAFPADPPQRDGALPAELALALDRAARDGVRPPTVRVDAECADADLQRWQRDAGVAFVRGAPWRWQEAPATAFAEAIDLLQGEFALAARPARARRRRLFRWAAVLAGSALALHVALVAGEWAWLKVDGYRQTRAWTELATTAGIAREQADSPAAARAALLRRHGELRHAAGLAARDDALPLLARAAPALALLPPGSVRRATFADGHWTLDLAPGQSPALGDVETRMRAAGMLALTAATAAGTRVRFGAP